MQIEFSVNRIKRSMEVDPKERLLDILRDNFELTSVKEGCGKGECGACTVILNGLRVNSCLVPALQLNGASVFTVEGFTDTALFNKLEKSYVEHGAVQCGFCISGFVISTIGFLAEIDEPASYEYVRRNLAGNICRCTGYKKILDAVYHLNSDTELIKLVHKSISQDG